MKKLRASAKKDKVKLRKELEESKQAIKRHLEELKELRESAKKDKDELRRELEATKRDLEELKELRASTEKDADKLRKELQEFKQATKGHLEELGELRGSMEKNTDDPIRKLENSTQTTEMHGELEKTRAIKDRGEHEENRKTSERPLFSCLRGIFGSTKSKKKKKKKWSCDEATNLQLEEQKGTPVNSYYGNDSDSEEDVFYDTGSMNLIARNRMSHSSIGYASNNYGNCTDFEQGLTFRRSKHSSRQSSKSSSVYWDARKDEDEEKEKIQIIEEPSSKVTKEGSKVELVFKCNSQDNSKIIYQWFKDDTKLHGKNKSVLLLKSVTLPDFGCYKCHASCKNSSSDKLESDSAELDVTPRDGTRYKYLNEIDPNTQDRIETLLTQKRHGLGGWKQVAFKYGMEQLNIRCLQDDPEAGRKTLEYLESHSPYLTVYDFCKTLKESNIRRLDIVKELLGHLSVSSSALFM
ncbi:uncharacterized protein LOC144654163 [Oculina patagonica]